MCVYLHIYMDTYMYMCTYNRIIVTSKFTVENYAKIWPEI